MRFHLSFNHGNHLPLTRSTRRSVGADRCGKKSHSITLFEAWTRCKSFAIISIEIENVDATSSRVVLRPSGETPFYFSKINKRWFDDADRLKTGTPPVSRRGPLIKMARFTGALRCSNRPGRTS